MERPYRFVMVTALSSLALVAAPWACSPSANETESTSFETSTTTSASSTGGGGGAGASGSTGSGGEVLPDIDSGLPDPDAACGLVTENGNRAPLNLYIMLDRSNSMDGFRWTAATTGLKAFAADPASAGIRLALKFFPRAPDNDPVCDALPYKVPDVPFGELPANESAIASALTSAAPDGFNTPIYPALSGGLLKGLELVSNSPDESSAVLLVTDGEPEGACEKDPAKIVEMAKAGAAKHVLTYVIGLPGVNQALANQIAAAGGSDKAIVIGKENVEADFASALAKVRGDALPCNYLLPKKVGSEFNLNQVNVLFTNSGGTTSMISQDETCAGEGWHYDSATKPTEIVLCPASCALAKNAGTGKIQVLLGCETKIK